EMEYNVWPVPEIEKMLREDYIVVSLYTDDRTALPEEERFYSDILQTTVNTIGKKFKHLQAEKYNTISQPYYVLISPDEELLVAPPIGAEFNKGKFRAYLEKGLVAFGD